MIASKGSMSDHSDLGPSFVLDQSTLSTSFQHSSAAVCICTCKTGLPENGDRLPAFDFALPPVDPWELGAGKYEPEDADGVASAEYDDPTSVDIEFRSSEEAVDPCFRLAGIA